MELATKLYDALKDIEGGIYALSAPQDKEYPYSVYQIISDIKTNVLDGQCDYPQTRFQIDIYDGTLQKTIDIKAEIEAILLTSSAFKAIIYQTFSNMTDDGNVYHTIVDFKLTT